MKKTLFAIGSLACLSLAASCRQNNGERKDNDQPPSSIVDPIPSDGLELPIAVPVEGFTLQDLLPAYCTVTLLNSNEELLVGEVNIDSATGTEKIWFSLYFPYKERGFVEKTTYYLKDIKSSTCDMSKIATEQAVHLALAPISVYADANLKGEPVCTFSAGSTLVSDSSYVPASTGALPFTVPANYDCKGLARGWLNEWPAILPVHPRP